MANGEFLDALSESAFTDIKKYNSEILEIIKNVSKVREEFNGITMPSQSSDAIKKLNADYLKQEEVLKKSQLAYDKLAESKAKSDKTKTNTNNQSEKILKQLELETKNRQALDKQRERALQLLEKEQAKLNAANGAYNKLQSELTSLSNEYKNLAVKKELGNQLTESESKRYETLQGKITNYDKALKAVDASMGKYTRNVGNYSGAFNPLSNSINQLTREAPAFANSIGTGFMAVSNNFPAFFDAISQINAKNKELIANGEPTKSVFKELASSLFSVQTLLSVGVTLLTIYGEQIVEAAMSIDVFQKNAEKLKTVQVEINSQSVAQSKNLDKYRDVVNNTNLSEKERNNALNLLKDSIPQLNKVTLEQANALELVNSWTDKYVKNAVLRYKADELIKAAGEQMILQSKLIQEQQSGTSSSGFIDYVKALKLKDALTLMSPLLINIKDLQKRAAEEANKRTNNEILASKETQNSLEKEIELTVAQIGSFDKTGKQTEKTAKQKKDLILLNYDYIQSEYELAKAILDRKLAESGDIANNENLLFEKRIIARQNFSRLSIELADLEYQKNIDLSKKEQEDDLLKNLETYQKNKENKTLSVKERQIAEQQYSDNIFSIGKDYIAKNETIEINHSEKINQLRNQDLAFFKAIQDKQNDYSLETIKFIADGEKAKLKLIIDNQKLTTATRQEAFEKHTEILKKELELQKLIELEKNPNNQQSTIEHYQNLNAELDNLSKTASPAAEKLKELRKLTEDYISSSSKQFLGQNGFGSLDLFTDMDVNGKSSFENMLENAEGFKEKFAVIFNSIGDVAKDVFSFIQQSSQENFEKEKQQLEEQYTIATAFAGDSAEAKKEIDKQYQEKQKEIRNREAKANKEMAMFNIGISTAQGVISALAQPIPNIPLSIFIGVIGALKLAMVASTEIPKYFKGGVHGGGLGMINDGGGSSYQEIVKTPDGNISQYSGRNLVLDMPKGTEIFTPEQWQNYQLKQLLNGTGVSMSKNTPEIAMFSDLQVNKIVNAVKNMPVSDLNFDNGKFQNHVKNGHQTKINLNARVTFAGENV